MTVRLTAFTCGWLNLRYAFLLEGAEGRINAPVPVYLIEHPKGRALFDTGLGQRFISEGDTPAVKGVDFQTGADIAARLKAVGVDPDSIQWIINSHLHTDHAGGNAYIPNATVIVQAAEWDFAFEGKDQFYKPEEFDLGHRVVRIRGEHDLFGDGSVLLFPSPGHTPGHQCARVRLAAGEIVLAADCCNLKASLDDMRLPDHVHDREASLATLVHLRSLRESGARIFYGHDPDFWTGVPQGVPLT